MKKLIYPKRYLIIGIVGVIILIGLSVWFFSSKHSSQNNYSKKEMIWNTVEVQTAKDFSSIKIPAKVKSNQFAIISPRRTGIIQDLLVDIGDEVYKGQTIGSMLPEGVEGQSSAAIAEASARLQKARAELGEARSVASGAVAVASKQWQESNLKYQTQSTLDNESLKQLEEKKREAVIVATQVWEDAKFTLFGANANNIGSRSLQGNFSNSSQENNVKRSADEIQRMEESGDWGNTENIVEHLSHLENFLQQAEILYKNAIDTRNFTKSDIEKNMSLIQRQQIQVSQMKQSILSLEEKSKRLSSEQAEKGVLVERSEEFVDLVQSQQNLSITQAEKNVQVALANYNAALVKSGHQSITSPFNGIITARMAEVGQAVAMNMPLFYIEGAQTSRSQEWLSEIHFSLPESWRNKVFVGDKVSVKTMEGESYEGKIFRLSEHVNLGTNSIMTTAVAIEKEFEIVTKEKESENNSIEEDIEKETQEVITPINFEHGQSLFIYITASDSNIFTVPTLALKKRSNNYSLWKIEEENPIQLNVHVVAEDGEYSQVFSKELKTDDSIISNPSVSLFTKSK